LAVRYVSHPRSDAAWDALFARRGKMGLLRNLTPLEIVAQVFCARHILKKIISAMSVFMGMGEPLR
jgi:adenine C2-methylase RlmN of 23S rRNA A2503 and tRNA A37